LIALLIAFEADSLTMYHQFSDIPTIMVLK